jgi:hypothetical protein
LCGNFADRDGESPIGILRSKPERRIGLDEQMIAMNIKEGRGAAITKHYSELTLGLVYHPVILGEDMLPVFGLQQLLIWEE